MTESIGTARLDIVVDTSSLDAGVNKAKRSTQGMAKASQDASQKMEQASKRQLAALEKSVATYGKSRAELLKWRIEQQTSGKAAAELTAKLDQQIRRTEMLERARKDATEQVKRLASAEAEAQRRAAAGLDAQGRRIGATGAIVNGVGSEVRRLALQWAALGAATITAAVGIRSFKSSIDFADKLNDINQRLGISAETLSGWAYAAQQTGTDIDALGVGMKKLAKNMAEALDADSSQGKLFKALGVSVKDAKGNLRGLEDILPEIASGFKNIQSETLKAALAQELFGKSGTDLIEFLNQGADGLDSMRAKARDLGVELSQGTLSAADEFNDKVGDLQTAVRGFSTQLAAELLPAMTKLTEALTDMVKDGTAAADTADLISTALDGVASGLNRLDGFGDVVSGLAQGFTELLGAASAVARLDFSTAANIFRNSDSDARIGAGITQMATGEKINTEGRSGLFGKVTSGSTSLQGRELALAQARAKLQKNAEDRLLGLFSEGKSGGSKKAKKEGKSDAEREIERLEAAYKSFADSQRERIALFGEESEAAKVRYEIENGALKGVSAAKAQELIANAERIDQLRDEAEVQKELDRINKARTDRVQDVLDDIKTETDLLGKSVEYQDTYNKLKYAGVDANSAFGQSIIDANHALHEQGRATERQIELMDTFRTEASDAIADVVTGTKSLSDAFKDMFDNIAERITQMIADRWIEQLFGQMGTSGGGQSGDWIGQLFRLFSGWGGGGGPGWAKGGAFDNGMPVRAFAMGGVVDRTTGFYTADGRRNIMGESGPEAIIPLSRGRDGKLGVRMEGGASSTFAPVLNQTFVVSGTPDNRTREQMARSSGREAARGIARTGR